MFCSKCGTQMADDSMRCPSCGNDVAGGNHPGKTDVPVDRNIIPDAIKGFNFGALSLNWIWAFAHNLWLLGFLIILLPCINLIPMIYIGFKGNELAWKARKFTSVQQFKDTQKVWTIVGAVVFPMYCLMIPAILAAIALPAFLQTQDRAKYYSCLEELKGIKVAQEVYGKEFGKFAGNPDALAMLIIAGCKDETGMDLACSGKVIEKADMRCKPGTFRMSAGETGKDFRILGQAKNSNQCSICLNETGFAPADYYGCKKIMSPEERCAEIGK